MAGIKKDCKKCGRTHYEGTSCIPKKFDNSHNLAGYQERTKAKKKA